MENVEDKSGGVTKIEHRVGAYSNAVKFRKQQNNFSKFMRVFDCSCPCHLCHSLASWGSR